MVRSTNQSPFGDDGGSTVIAMPGILLPNTRLSLSTRCFPVIGLLGGALPSCPGLSSATSFVLICTMRMAPLAPR